MFESYLDKKINAARGLMPKRKPQQAVKEFKEERLRENVDYLNSRGILEQGTVDYIQKDILKDRAPTSFAYGGLTTPKRGLVDGPGSYSADDRYVLSDDLKKLIKEKIKLKPGQKWNFYNPDTGKGHTFGVPKGTPFYDKARYYGGKQAKDLARKKEELAKMSPKERAEYNRIKAEKTKKFLEENPDKAKARRIQQLEYRSRPDIIKRDIITREAYEATPERKKMKKKYITQRLTKIGLWPTGNNFKENVWRDLYRSSQVQNPRWVVANEKGKPLTVDQYPKREGKTFWGEGKYKQVRFLDTKTGQVIKLDDSIKGKGISMEKYLNSNFGKGTYDNALNSYRSKDAMKNYEIEIGGKKQKLGTVLRNRIIAPDKIDQLFGSSVFHVSHDEGVGKNWWKSRVTTGDANLKLKDLDRTLQRDLKIAKNESEKNKAIKAYEKKVRKLPGGIISTLEQGTFGIEPTEKSVIEALSKKARIRGSKGYKDLLNKTEMFEKAMNKRGTKVKAQTVSKLAKDMNVNICSTQIVKKSGGGRIGFKGKICGEEFAKKQPEQFLAQVENSPLQEKLVKLKNNNPARFKALMKNTGKVAKVLGRSTFGPLGLVGGEAIAYGLTDWAGGKMGLSSETSSDVAAWWNNKDSAREDIYKAMEKLGYTDGEQAAVNKFLDATNSQALYERAKVAGASDLAQNYEPMSGMSQEKMREIVEFRIAQAKQKYDNDVESMFNNMFIGTGINPNEATEEQFDKQIDITSEQAMGGLRQATRTAMQDVDPKRYEAMTTQVNPYAGPIWNLFTGNKAIRSIFGNERAQNLGMAEIYKKMGQFDKANEIIRIENEKINFPMSQATWHDQTFKVPMQAMQGWLDNTVGGFGTDTSTAYGTYMPQMMAGGGIASIRRPNAIPPEKGPLPQGLENLRYYVT